MDYIKLIRFDVIAIIIFIFTIVISAIKNQKIVWRRTLCLLFSMLMVGVIFYFNFGNLFTLFSTYVTAFVYLAAQKLNTTFTYSFARIIVFLAAVLLALLIDLLLNGIALLIGSDRKKYEKYPSYATTYQPVLSVLGGIIKGALIVYCMYFVFLPVAELVHLDTSTDLIINLLRKFEPVYSRLKEFVLQVQGV